MSWKVTCIAEPKSKRQRASLKQEETTLMATSEMVTTGVGLAGMDQLQNKQNASSGGFSQKPYFVSSEVVTDLFSGDSQLPVVDEKNANYLEQRNKDLVKERVMEKNLNSNAEHIFTQDDLASPGLSTCKTELCVQVSCKDGEHSKLSSRYCQNLFASFSMSWHLVALVKGSFMYQKSWESTGQWYKD